MNAVRREVKGVRCKARPPHKRLFTPYPLCLTFPYPSPSTDFFTEFINPPSKAKTFSKRFITISLSLKYPNLSARNSCVSSSDMGRTSQIQSTRLKEQVTRNTGAEARDKVQGTSGKQASPHALFHVFPLPLALAVHFFHSGSLPFIIKKPHQIGSAA